MVKVGTESFNPQAETTNEGKIVTSFDNNTYVENGQIKLLKDVASFLEKQTFTKQLKHKISQIMQVKELNNETMIYRLQLLLILKAIHYLKKSRRVKELSYNHT